MNSGDWLNVGLTFGPLILIVGIWIFMMRAMRGKGGRQWQDVMDQQVQLLEKQNELLKETNELLKKIVAK